jgi:hypothetical protein
MNSENMKKVGRPAGKLEFIDIEYNNIKYIVGKLYKKDMPIKFIFDKDDEEKVKSRFWHCTSAGYISSSQYIDGKERQLLLHRLVMNKLDFPGKGATESVDHINRNPLDNRKENLRIISQTEQNLNQKKKPRNIVELPENCGIEPNEIPRHIWYVKPNGAHGDRFAIELKTENLVWKTTSSKKLSLKEKLNQAKEKLEQLYIQYPYLNPDMNENTIKAQELCKSFDEIIVLSEAASSQ